LGFQREELIGVPASELLHPEEVESLAPATRAFAKGLTDHLHSIQRLRHKELGYTLVETTVRSSTSAPGLRPAGACAIARAPGRTSETVERPAVSLAPAAVGSAYAWITEGSRRAVLASANSVFAMLLQTTTSRLVGRPLEELTDPSDPAVGVARLSALLDGSSQTYQVERRLGEAQALVELTVSLLPLTDRPGQMAVIHARDVTRQRESDAATQNSLWELQRSNRELEAFASVAARDLSAPLRVVIGYADLLKQQTPQLDPQVGELLGKVASTSRRLQAQVDGLMKLARIDGDELVTAGCDTSVLMDEALELLRDEVRNTGARIHIGPLPVVNCNAMTIAQVFQNLLSNAIKYGGERPVVQVKATRQQDAWCFTVSDRGRGLPEGREDDLFELFERGRAHTDAPGAGIGLAICKRIIDRHGGRIWCKQRHGGGAEFHFTLPDRY
jgi:signal transduction histidine kinase